jgi:hypothetical protein
MRITLGHRPGATSVDTPSWHAVTRAEVRAHLETSLERNLLELLTAWRR